MKPSSHQASRVQATRVLPETEFSGFGCVIQGFGLLAPVAGFLLGGYDGLAMGCVVLLVLLVAGSMKSRRWVCGACGNPLYSNAVTLCPSCRNPVRYEPSLWPWLVLFVSLTLAGVAVISAPKWMDRVGMPAASAQPAGEVAELPSLAGWAFAEVVSRHGEPLTKDKETGWAVWPSFRARFEGGAVVEVDLPGGF